MLKRRGKGAWAEEWCQQHLGMEPLNRTATLKGAYHPDGKLGAFLVSVKSTEGKTLRIDLDAWREHAVAAFSQHKRPLLVMILDREHPVMLVAGYSQDLQVGPPHPDE